MIINGKSIRDDEKIRNEINNLTEDEARDLRVFIKGMKLSKASGKCPGGESGKGKQGKGKKRKTGTKQEAAHWGRTKQGIS